MEEFCPGLGEPWVQVGGCLRWGNHNPQGVQGGPALAKLWRRQDASIQLTPCPTAGHTRGDSWPLRFAMWPVSQLQAGNSYPHTRYSEKGILLCKFTDL